MRRAWENIAALSLAQESGGEWMYYGLIAHIIRAGESLE